MPKLKSEIEAERLLSQSPKKAFAVNPSRSMQDRIEEKYGKRRIWHCPFCYAGHQGYLKDVCRNPKCKMFNKERTTKKVAKKK